MVNWKRYIPEGTKDILFKECGKKIEIENILRKTYTDSGFLELTSPTLEFYDVFIGDNSTLPQEKMYKLFDNQGRILVLRPDMTTPIARIAATKLKDTVYPLRLCYTSNVYRVNESLNGKNSEFTQSGIEIIGIKGTKADVDAIITGITALVNCGLKDFKIELGQAEFFKAIMEEVSLDTEEKEELKKYIEDKNFTALSELLYSRKDKIDESTLRILKELPKLFGDIKILDKASELTNNTRALEALDNIRNVYKAIDSIGLSQYLSVDLGMIQNLDYYTGIIFRGYTHGIGGNILSGGRYDNLVGQFGEDKPATGFAIDVDSILKALETCKFETPRDKVLVLYEDGDFEKAYKKAVELRQDNVIAEIALLDSEQDALRYAKEKEIDKIIKI
ncbi:ATP phosphoribosyltransferase regulatory subunit [Clostridium sp. DJ247]|uniref:ATP phosphoribosyltransferase regulatory subunit n=1 Tax=Clostridium sp. DJ247 TaxID=2726188 RepID=UPI0016241E17|nr:ATP phosphoribosyltransferase regulatory subunit [Clostridium sp. DJ247]MBC2582839.1 ATP phosphoribosyltransferase regulatory subunit [Clostridium sp. DJ247]